MAPVQSNESCSPGSSFLVMCRVLFFLMVVFLGHGEIFSRSTASANSSSYPVLWCIHGPYLIGPGHSRTKTNYLMQRWCNSDTFVVLAGEPALSCTCGEVVQSVEQGSCRCACLKSLYRSEKGELNEKYRQPMDWISFSYDLCLDYWSFDKKLVKLYIVQVCVYWMHLNHYIKNTCFHERHSMK